MDEMGQNVEICCWSNLKKSMWTQAGTNSWSELEEGARKVLRVGFEGGASTGRRSGRGGGGGYCR